LTLRKQNFQVRKWKRVGDLIAEYGMAKSTTSTIKKKNEGRHKNCSWVGDLKVKQLDGNFALGCGPGMDNQ